MEDGSPVAKRSRLALYLTLAGALLLVGLLGAVVLRTSRARLASRWDRVALRATCLPLDLVPEDPIGGKGAWSVRFRYLVENTTDRDLRISSHPMIAVRLRRERALDFNPPDPFKVKEGLFIPAHGRSVFRVVEYEVIPPESGSWEFDQELLAGLASTAAHRFTADAENLEGLVLLDEASHLQVDLPWEWRWPQGRLPAGPEARSDRR
jgi:hypothetical protein